MTEQLSHELIPAFGAGKIRQLPPLILHPFADANGPGKIAESSRASLMIQGLLPSGTATHEELDRQLIEGRYSEIRMLFYVGKDVLRWIEQCLEHLQRTEGRVPAGVTAQSFAALLVQHTPPAVVEKLRKWGVNDFKSIFSRSIGLHAMFMEMPARECLAPDFVRSYFRYADQLFFAYQSQAAYDNLDADQFRFEIYSSGEYSRILELQWE